MVKWNSLLKTHTLIEILLSLTTITFSLLMILEYLNSNYIIISSIQNNWKTNLLFPNDQKNLTSKCSKKPLIFGKWQGIHLGCDCGKSNITVYKLYRRRCSSKLPESLLCKNVKEIPEENLYNWKDAYLCRSQLQYTNYRDIIQENDLNFLVRSSEDLCPNNTRNCGVIDSVSNILCVKREIPCPMNFIKFYESYDKIPENLRSETLIKLVNGFFVLSNNFLKGKILVDFRIMDSQPCANPDYENEKTKPYLLDMKYGYDSCKIKKVGNHTYDKRYEILDQDNFKELYTLNNNLYLKIKELPNYDIEKRPNKKLYARPYIGIKYECLKELEHERKLNGFTNRIFSLEDHMYQIFYIMLSAVIISIIYYLKNITCNIIRLFKRNIDVIHLIVDIIFIIFFFAGFVLIILFKILLQRNYERKILTNSQCVDKITYTGSRKYYRSTSVCLVYSNILVILNVLIFLGYILRYLIRRKDQIGGVRSSWIDETTRNKTSYNKKEKINFSATEDDFEPSYEDKTMKDYFK